jgi:Protein of unknown function (DUF1579)
MPTPNRRPLWSILPVMLSLLITLANAQNPASDFTKIHEAMSKLAPFVGKWDAVAIFHNRDGTVVENDGIWEINWALEETYLEFHVAMHRKGDPTHHNGFVTFITYNPRTEQYDLTYFYTHSALRVSETGVWDEKTKHLLTKAFIPLEDGVRDENVRTIHDLSDPNKITHTHYNRYSNEAAERLQVVFTLTHEQ